MFLSNRAEVHFLWKVLADEPIDILIQSTFPGGVGVSKVKPCLQLPGNRLVLGKFFAIIRGNGMHRGLEMAQQSHHSLADRRGGAACHMGQQRVHGFALGQGDQRWLLPFANDRIHFPVTDAGLPVHHRRALINRYGIDQLAAALIAAVALLALLLAAQVSVQLTTGCLVLVYVLIYPFMAQADAFSFAQPVTNLFRAPFILQPGRYPQPQTGGNPCLITRCPAGPGQVVSLVRTIDSQASITAEFTANRGFMYPGQSRDLNLLMACFHQCINLISLRLGKLCVVSHLCLSFLLERKVRILPQLAVRAT